MSQWRLFYRGCHYKGTFVKLSLEEAAQRVKISKKSLDDYLMQLRSAKKYGFEFEKHTQDKVGIIRSFVRKKKEEERLAASGKTLSATKDVTEENNATTKGTRKSGRSSAQKTNEPVRRVARKRDFKTKYGATPTSLFRVK